MTESAPVHSVSGSGKRRRWPWITILLFLLAMATVRLVPKTELAHQWVRGQIIRSAGDLLEAKLEIESVKGDLFREIMLLNLRVIQQQDTVFRIDTLRASYDVWSYFQSEFQVTDVKVVAPYLQVKQSAGGEWNLATLVKRERVESGGTDSPFLFNIDRFSVTGGEIESRVHSLAPDSMMVVGDLNFTGGFGYFGENYRLRLDELGFNLEKTQFSSPVTVHSSLEATGGGVTLEKLIVATGTSMLQSSAAFNRVDSSAKLRLSAQPLSLNDVSAYAAGIPVRKDLRFDLSLSGNPGEFDLLLEAEAEGVEGVRLVTGFRWDETLVAEEVELQAARLDLGAFWEDSLYPVLRDLHFRGSGRLNFAEPEQAELSGVFSASHLSLDRYGIDRLEGGYALNRGVLNTDARVVRGSETVEANLQASRIWSGEPAFTLEADGKNIDPSYWLQDREAAGRVHFTAKLDGMGYRPGERYWNYDLDVKESLIAGQQITQASMSGKWNRRTITAQSRLRLQKSRVRLQAEVNNYADHPEYEFDLVFDGLNLAECRGLENFTTSINAQIRGEGRNLSPESLQLVSSINIDSSVVNGEYIEELSADVLVRDTVAQLTGARLRSDIADGSFDARFHLLDRYVVENRLNLDMQVKDVQSLAPLVDAERLQAVGAVKGTLNPVNGNKLQFSGSVDFSDVVYNDLLTSQRVKGDVKVLLVDDPEYILSLNLDEPVINSVVLQDVNAMVRGKSTPESSHGDYQLMFSSPSESRIQLFGSYHIGQDTTQVQTIDFQVISENGSLSLDRPFRITATANSFSMDTVRLDSDNGASLEMAIPYADTLIQSGYLEGRNLNMTVIQNTLLNHAYFEGILSGRIYLDRRNTVISSYGNLKLEDLVYRGVKLDSLSLRYRLSEERLEGGLHLHDRGKSLAEGQLRVPFKLGDPNTFAPEFFEENIFGYLRVNEVAVSRFDEILEPAGITGTGGLFRFGANLRGKAGQPEIDASFRLTNATLSGVALDSVTAAFDYSHSDRKLDMSASVMSFRQKAAEITGQIPVFVDLKNFSVQLPDEDDRIRMQISTNRFNLASLNDFVNRTRYREIRGRVDGQVTVSGQAGNLSTSGRLNFSDGAVRIVEAGIRVEDIRSELVFDNHTVRLTQLYARSGNGTLRAGGTMELDHLRPSGIDVKMRAENLRIANTSEYSAVINMNTRLGGTFSKPHMQGTLNFISGFIYLQNFGDRSIEEVKLDSAPSPGYDYHVKYDSLSLDIDVSFDRRFYIRNRRFLDLEYELEGQVDLVKEKGRDIRLFGSLSAVEGYVRPLGKRFQLEEGMITFAGDPVNPEMNVRHLFEPPQQKLGDIRIWYIIEGTVESPRFKYESEPPMGLEDIISYTLFGKPFMSLDPWKQVVANSGSNVSAANVAMDVLMDKVEMLATQRLGIDVVQIDNTRSGGGDTGTSIKTGWYLNPKVFFAIQKEIAGTSPDTIFILEYLLKKNIKLIITQGSNTQTGIDLKWDYDY